MTTCFFNNFPMEGNAPSSDRSPWKYVNPPLSRSIIPRKSVHGRKPVSADLNRYFEIHIDFKFFERRSWEKINRDIYVLEINTYSREFIYYLAIILLYNNLIYLGKKKKTKPDISKRVDNTFAPSLRKLDEKGNERPTN